MSSALRGVKDKFFPADLYVARKVNFHVFGFKDFNIL